MYRRPAQLTEQTVSAAHQRALNELLAEFNRQMDVTWTLLDLDNLDATRKAWLQHAVQVVSDHQEQAAEVAAQFCQDWSQVFTGQSMDILKPGLQADKVIRDAETALDALGPAGVKKRIAQGISPEAASRAALDAVKAGGAHRVLDADRQTIIRSAHNDPRCTGWRRVTHGGCKFCNMLAGRGEVYTAESVRFASHDHCRCTAVPAYGGPEVNVHQYTASKRKITDKQRAQLKRYLDDLEDDGVTVKEDATSPTLASRGGSDKPPSKPPRPPSASHPGQEPEDEQERRSSKAVTPEGRYIARTKNDGMVEMHIGPADVTLSDQVKSHILYGDSKGDGKRGGGHLHATVAAEMREGQIAFPATWDEERVLTAVKQTIEEPDEAVSWQETKLYLHRNVDDVHVVVQARLPKAGPQVVTAHPMGGRDVMRVHNGRLVPVE